MAATPQRMELAFDPATSVGTISVSQMRGIYRGVDSVRDVLIWTGTASTGSTGLFSAMLTEDGTSTGTALFSEVLSAHANHLLNTTSASNACFAILRGYTTGLKTAAFLGARGSGMTAPTGTVYQITVIGLPL